MGVLNILFFHPYLGKWSIFQMSWNHQLVFIRHKIYEILINSPSFRFKQQGCRAHSHHRNYYKGWLLCWLLWACDVKHQKIEIDMSSNKQLQRYSHPCRDDLTLLWSPSLKPTNTFGKWWKDVWMRKIERLRIAWRAHLKGKWIYWKWLKAYCIVPNQNFGRLMIWRQFCFIL